MSEDQNITIHENAEEQEEHARYGIDVELFQQMLWKRDFTLFPDAKEEFLTTDEAKAVRKFIKDYMERHNGHYPDYATYRNHFPDAPLRPDEGFEIYPLLVETKNAWARGALKELNLLITDVITESPSPIDAYMDAVLPQAVSLSKELVIQDRTSVNVVDQFMDTIEKTLFRTERGIPFPWPSLTKITHGGMQKGELIVLAGRPKSRKTFLATHIACHAFFVENKNVLIISPEMHPVLLHQRIIATVSKIPYAEFKAGQGEDGLQQDNYERLIEKADEVQRMVSRVPREGEVPEDMPRFVVENGAAMYMSQIDALITEHKPDFVFIDSFYRLQPDSSKKSDADWKVVTGLIRELKNLAARREIPILITHQLNRQAAGKVAKQENLAYSDSVSQECDLCISINTGPLAAYGECSLLSNTASRETNFDGLVIHNKPCSDFSEITTVSDTAAILKEMNGDVDDDEEEPSKSQKAKAQATRKKKTNFSSARKVSERAATLAEQEAPDDADYATPSMSVGGEA